VLSLVFHAGKKWWFNLYKNTLLMAKVNAWLLYRFVNKELPTSHIEFLRSVAISLMNSEDVVSSGSDESSEDEGGAPSQRFGRRAPVPEKVRYNGKGHYPEKLNSRLRCAMCMKLCNLSCAACSKAIRRFLPLHVDCFSDYHSQ
jgi:hypothetical protein